VHYASPRRHISIWEVHVHNYMATVPLYLLMLIVILNWDVAVKAATLNWAGEFYLRPATARPGGTGYLPAYLTFMAVLCVFPYFEENIRCLRHALGNKRLGRISVAEAGDRAQLDELAADHDRFEGPAAPSYSVTRLRDLACAVHVPV